MKISNNALNFLLAQYRAIFKRAYVKGIASAVILTAGLAAGAAQAEGDDFYYIDATGQYQTGLNGMTSGSGALGAYQDNRATVNDKSSAPNNEITGQISDGHLSVGTVAGDDINTVSGNAFGAYLNISGTNITSFNASENDVTLHSGGEVAVNLAGAYLTVDSGNATATDNKATINGGSVANSTYGAFLNTSGGTATATGNGVVIDVADGISATVHAQTATSDGIFGARIKTEDGVANASGNYVEITAGETATLSLGNGGNGIVGALAEGTESVSVTGNRVNITVEGDTAKSLGSVYSIQGGFALNQTDGKEASTLTADSNSVTATRLNLTSTSGAYIFGGRALQDNDASGSASELVARNNTVSLTSTNVDTSANALQVVGNMAVANPGTAPTGAQNSVSAIGDGTNDNVYVDGGNFSSKVASLASGFLTANSMIAGGYAETFSGGGNAVANLNKATIKNITGTNVNLYGGVAYSIKSAEGDQVSASQNTLAVDAITLNVDSGAASGYTSNSIVGGFAALGDTVTKAAATASNNTVTVTNSTYSKDNSEKLIEADIAGAIVSTTTSGAAITANQNSVTVDQGSNVKGNVFGAYSNYNGSFAGNTVSVNATLNNVAAAGSTVTPVDIAGVNIATGDTKTGTDNVTLTATGNTVTIGANAKITNANIEAVSLAKNNATDTDVIHSGNTVTVNGTYIVNDATAANKYNLAGDDVQITSTALIHVKKGTLNISGISDHGDTIKYYNGTGTVAAGAKIANADIINVYNSLDVQGDDSLFAVSNGAQLNVDGGSAKNEAKDFDPVTPEKATLKISQAGLTNYLTATKDLAYDLDGDAQQVKEANDAAGAVTVTSGGTIDFKDTVLLSAFDFTSGGATAGKINVDTGAINTTAGSENGSYFKADTVTVAHKLATNTTSSQGKYGNLTALDNTSGVAIVANTLNLGAADLSSTRSAAITFGKATVKEEINFLARTSGKDIADDAAGTELTTFNDGYHLTSEVIGSNFMLTNDQDSNKEYYTSLAGNINGVVTVEGANGHIHIKDGDWTANDLVTVTSGGNITVGSGSETDLMSALPRNRYLGW